MQVILLYLQKQHDVIIIYNYFTFPPYTYLTYTLRTTFTRILHYRKPTIT